MSCIISKTAKIGRSVQYGHNTVIADNVTIGDNVEIGHGVIIHEHVVIGDNTKILDNAVLGKMPAKASMSATTGAARELPELTIGKAVTIGAGCVIYRGASIADMVFFGDIATVREDVTIGEGTIIGRGVTVENKVSIGKKTKIETNAYITAFSTVEDYCFIAPCVVFSNDNYLGRTEERKKHFRGPTIKTGARIGAGAVLLPGVVIEEDALVAAGSVVTKDVPPRITVLGIPAKEWRPVPQEQLLEEQVYYEK
ncbi:N-acetyltransferase [Cloacibacillus porcorum]|uniref:acyltransferase n=2 Tax=Cloacibacillus porcorum TaxID=1197717 RepID=UPI0014594835|nr:N-acetyltransferase [Cloacibacillus porcorum]MCC8184601.1 N-acetyltransferase [Cloacibacillus porcorum]NMF18067.1 N-acetyltransferase [Cloacibacillus porcorum]